DVCGRQMVVKNGRFGRFLACPGFPECTFTKPLVIAMPGRCPRCSSRILKRTSKNGHTYYACEKGADCGFMTWYVPVKEDCPTCGKMLFKPSGRGQKKPFCINEECPQFVPEEKRGYRRKSAAKTDADKTGAEKTEDGAAEAKKPAAKKTKTASKTAKKTTSAAKKTTASTAKKTAAASKTKKTAKAAGKESE
ncbi:MAG: topoisomerase DNA-binding C4 zinc finger domain-containing protein, partial [Oscillospiraceae bacterium]|nr:topoisomerase DNA-binding C4 zinc finger domain-containing protein [Oscillospiraceae bacterium]